MKDYIICIPSYKRAQVCNDKTLTTLEKNKIPASKIYVYVANQEEYVLYKETLDPKLYHKLIVGKKGLVQQRDYIMSHWPKGKWIVFMDDDLAKIDLSLSSQFKHSNLDHFIEKAFEITAKENAYIWGVYPVYNPFFRKTKEEISSCLKYIVGAFYGIINRPQMKSLDLVITKANGQKEDVERTLKYFLADGKVIRFNKIGFETKYYGKEGGLGRFEDRLKPMKEASEKLEKKYGKYGYIKVRGNGMTEFVLRKIDNIDGEKKKSNDQKTKKRVVFKKKSKKTRKNRNT
jgi:hypothetical protein